MSETKTYVFPESGNNGGGGMMAMLAPLLQQKGIDPNLLVAMNGRNNSGFGGEGSWFIWVIFLFFLMGWGNNGWGNGGFGGGNMVISGSRESMNAEVAAMRNRSSEILGSVDHHRSVMESCDKMLQVLNPEFAERQRQDAENKALRQELSELKAMMADFFKSSEKASGSNNSKKQ